MEKTTFNRVILESNYLISMNTTIREVANAFNISKSTVHKDLKERLPLIDIPLSTKVRKVLLNNFMNRHIRGGNKTKEKYKKLK